MIHITDYLSEVTDLFDFKEQSEDDDPYLLTRTDGAQN